MTQDRIVFAFAGFVIVVSLLLANLHSPMWMWVTGFVGLNLFQSAFTRFCPLTMMLARLGVKKCSAADLAELRARE